MRRSNRPAQAIRGPAVALMALLGVLWLLAMGFALFQLQTEDQRLFDPAVLSEDYPLLPKAWRQRFAGVPAVRDALASGSAGVVLHAWDEDCVCAGPARDHLVSLRDSLIAAGVAVMLVAPSRWEQTGTESQRAESLETLRAALDPVPVSMIVDDADAYFPASPAAAVVGSSGEVAYLGPYSAGGSCTTSLGGFVESALRRLRMSDEIKDAWFNRTAIGCYCDWVKGAEVGE